MKESLLKKIFRRIKGIIIPETEVEKYRRLGAKIGNNCALLGANLDGVVPHMITIGDNVTITHALILAHDASTKRHLGYTKMGRVIIGNNVFVGWGATILANVVIGDNVIIGAGSVVTKNISANSVVVGNPARIVCSYDEYIVKNKKQMSDVYISDKLPSEWTDYDLLLQKNCFQNGGWGYIK